ncbi:MAG: DUF222 domain-containing protein [Actinomycetota bacterium]
MADGWRDITDPTGCPWVSIAPGPHLAAVLSDVDPSALADDARVSYLTATERLAGWVHVVQSRALVAVADAVEAATSLGPGITASHQATWVADEVAAALHIASRTASQRVNAAGALVRDWPVLGKEVASGRITVAQARAVYEGVSVLSGSVDAAGHDLGEEAVRDCLRFAADLPPARLRERVARLVTSLDPAAATRRRERSQRDLTDVSLWAEADGMACLASRGPAVDAIAMREIIDMRARVLRDSADEADDRTIGMWRHAALMTAFGLSPAGRGLGPVDVRAADDATSVPSSAPPASVDVQIRVTVPLTTLLDLTDTPGEVEGYGTIDADLARALAADAEWTRWVTDPVGDYLLDEGTRRFPGAKLARFLRSRESRCKHPSCGVRSANADADHLPAFVDGGRTSAAGMSPTCPRHNRGRQASGWAVHDEGPRDPHGPPDPVWTSPLGRRYQTHVSRALTLDHIPLRT